MGSLITGNNSMYKMIFGTAGVALILACSLVVYSIGLSNAKASSFQLHATNCVTSSTSSSGSCANLIEFGINPESYFSDKEYRKKVDSFYREIIENNAYIAPKVAQFTIDYAFKKKVKIASDIIKVLKEISADGS